MKQKNTHTPSEKLLILCAVCLAALVMPLSFTGPAVALSAIGRELGGSTIQLSWVTNAFMLSFGSSLMAAGTLADTYGRKRLFLIGVALFAIASFALALAPNIVCFDILRAVQGIAAAAAFSGGVAALAQEFDGHSGARAFSMLGTTFGLGLAFGPLWSGLLIEAMGWRAIFLSTAAVGIVALIFGARCMRESREPNSAGLDWPGGASFTAALTVFTYAVLRAPESGWASPSVIVLLLAAAVLLAAFVMIENRVRKPMLDLSLFRYPRFVGVQFLAAAPAYAYVVLLVQLPIRLVGIEGHSEIDAGRIMIALSAPMLVVPFIAAMLTRWISAGLISGTGLLISAGGLFWLAQFPSVTPVMATVWPMLTIGFGISLPWGLMDALAVSVVPRERAGMAAGIFSTTRVAGEGIALAIVGAALAALVQSNLAKAIAVAIPSAMQPAQLATAAGRVAMGDLRQAMDILPAVSHASLVQAYSGGFQTLLCFLAAATVLSAMIVFSFLRQPRGEARAGEMRGDGMGKPRPGASV